MKTRQGFVSNSSSSSFILSLAKKPESVEELKILLFKEQEFYYDPFFDEDWEYSPKGVEKYPTDVVAQTVFDDIKNQKPMTKEMVSEEMSSGWLDGSPEYDSFKLGSSYDWEAYDKAREDHASKIADELILESGDNLLFVVEYSDNDSSYDSALEHGPLFENIDSFRINKH